MTTRSTEPDVTYNKPYRRTETRPPETTWPTRVEPGADAAPDMPTRPEPAVAPGRQSLSDRISGGPVWSGFIIGFATWIFLEIVLVAVGLSGIGAGDGATVDASEWWWSLGAGLVALFVGGLIAGMASRWHTAGAGALQGLTVWALSFVAVLLLGAIGTGLGFGAFSDAIRVNADPAAIETARDAAGVSVALLAATAVAAVVGGVVGARLSGRAGQRAGRRSGRA